MIFTYNQTTGYLKFKEIGKNIQSHSSLEFNYKEIIDNTLLDIDKRWYDTTMMRKMKIARASYINALQGIDRAINDRFFIMPCNLDWSTANNRRFAVSAKRGKCLKFIAASYGDIFVVFATNPNNEYSWYYFQISSYGVALYRVSCFTLIIIIIHALFLWFGKISYFFKGWFSC